MVGVCGDECISVATLDLPPLTHHLHAGNEQGTSDGQGASNAERKALRVILAVGHRRPRHEGLQRRGGEGGVATSSASAIVVVATAGERRHRTAPAGFIGVVCLVSPALLWNE